MTRKQLGREVAKRGRVPAATAQDVVDEIEVLYREYGVRQMFFCDQIFNIPVSHAVACAQGR